MDPEVGRLIISAALSFAGGAGLTLWLDRVRGRRGRVSRIRALRREIDENIARLGPLDGTARGFPQRIERRAYDAADDVDFEGRAASALATAYVAGGEVNNRIELVDANLTSAAGAAAMATSSVTAHAAITGQQRLLSDAAIDAGRAARTAFESARDELRKLRP